MSELSFDAWISFDAWMSQVDVAVEAKVGLSVHDLEDCSFRDWWEDGIKSSTAASKAIKNSGGDFSGGDF